MTTIPVINFKRINSLDKNIMNNIIHKMMEQKYDTGKDRGYFLKDWNAEYIQGYLIVEYPTYILDFDPEEIEIKKIKTTKKVLIKFFIDANYNVLEIYSDKSGVNRLINEIGKLSEYALSISDVYFRASDIIKRLDEFGVEYTIKNLRIKDFSINRYTIGSFFVKVLENYEGMRLIREYGSLITYIGLDLILNSSRVSVGLYESGALRIYNKLESPEEVITSIKEILFGGGSNA